MGCGKSAQGNTDFCIVHGGGKRCAFVGCGNSARGATNYCKAHGGGKRCAFVGCGKSAHGTTDHCKAHGGGERCSNTLVHVEGGVDWPPPTVYWLDKTASLCFSCHLTAHPEKHPWAVRREQFLVAELHRLVPRLEKFLVVQDCPIPGACSMLRPDVLYDIGRCWIAVECDEGGLKHRETEGKYDTIHRELGSRPGFIIRVNPDNMFRRQYHTGQGLMYQAGRRFETMMRTVGVHAERMLERALGDEHLKGIEKTMLFF